MTIFSEYSFLKPDRFSKPVRFIGFCCLLFLFSTCKREIIREDYSNTGIQYYNGGNKDYVFNIVKTDDGGFLYTGHTYIDVNKIATSAFLLKVDANGKQQWYHTYGGKNRDIFRSAISTPDGGYLAVGRSYSGGQGIIDSSYTGSGYIVKTDGNGLVEWEKYINYSRGTSYYFSDFFTVKLMPDKKNYIIAGYNWYEAYNSMLAKIDLQGNLLFCNTYTPVNANPFKLTNFYSEFATDVIIADDNSIIAGGVMSNSNKVSEINSHLTFLLSLKSGGGSINYYYPYFDYLRGDFYYSGILYQKGEFPTVKLAKVPGGYMFATYIELPGAKIVTQLAKTDLSGKMIWQKQYAGLGNALVYNMDGMPDGNILLTGISTKYPVNRSYFKGFESQSTMLMLVDAEGNLIWEEYGVDIGSSIIAQCVQPLKEGGWRVGAFSSNNTSGAAKMFTFKVNEQGKIIIE